MQKHLQILFCTLIYFALLITTLHAQDWKPAHGSVTVSSLNDVQFVTDQIVYATGNSGTVIKSTDGGETWSDISFGESRNFLSLHFFDENTGYVGGPFNTGGGGSSEMLAKTTDGGANWEVLSSFDFDDFNDMEFLDSQTGWVASADGNILHTTDGGDSWISRSAGSENLFDFHVQNDSTYWVAGEYGSLYSSVDSGDTWNLAVDIDTLGLTRYSDSFYGVEFLNENVGFAVGQTYDDGDIAFVLKTTDGGDNWTRVTTHSFEYVVRDIDIGENGEIILAGGKEQYGETESNAIYISEDAGDTWSVISDAGGPLQWSAVDRVGDQWIAVGYTGAITLFTPASNALEESIITGLDITDVEFYDENLGVIATGGKVQGSLIVTKDGGETWNRALTLDGRKDFSSVSFADENNVWAVGTDHWTGDSVWLIYYSPDGGDSWVNLELDFPVWEQQDDIQNVQFLNSQTGYIKAGEKFLKTTNGGGSWFELEVTGDYSNNDFHTFQFIDENSGWLVGNDEIAATTDGGASWTIQYEQDSQSNEINELHFFDASTGYAAMDRGDMMKTDDGGTTWNNLSTGIYYDLADLEFVTADSGFVAGRGGIFLTTTDGGNSFTTEIYGQETNEDIYSIDMLDSQKGWMAGENGYFVTTNNGGGIATSIDEHVVQTLPSDIKLGQNYPNPFNPTTNISYEVPVRSKVTLEVYNMLGQKVATLVNNESKAAGHHTVSFDAGNLASGIYLYRLNAGGQMMSRQLSLIK
ncbi:T9SS type A sorting domain-containing protein [Rhodohalobacter sp. 8-1]|uniref:T9SS type A sorting domain-containing protein n=1 Tax=Rhodohalobacter sp. 8-1 TaxID=3131972 RepID=UPI0030EC562E